MSEKLIVLTALENLNPVIGDLKVISNKNISLINLDKNRRLVINFLKENGYKYFFYKDYKKILKSTFDKDYIKKIDFDYEWMENENFIMNYSNKFEIYSIDYKKIDLKNSYVMNCNFSISPCGNIFGFFNQKKTFFYCNNTLEKLFEIDLEYEIENLIFSNNCLYIALVTSEMVYIYNLFEGLELLKFTSQKFKLENNYIYLEDENKIFNFNDKKFINIKYTLKTDLNKEVKFYNEKIQKLEFSILLDNKKYIKTKNYNNIKKIDYFFTKNKLFVSIVKKIKNDENYIIESFSHNKITSTILNYKPEKIYFSDNYFVVYNKNKQVLFYKKDTYTFKLVKTIKKDGNVLLSLNNEICVVYDFFKSTIEIYDDFKLKYIYNQNLVDEITWSASKLYFSCFSKESGLLQIFNLEGKLLFKKIFVNLNNFKWRPFNKINENDKKKILKENDINNLKLDFDDDDDDISSLLSSWKSYLQIKKEEININK